MVMMLSFGRKLKIFVVMLLLVGSSLAVTTRLQLAQSSPNQTELPTYWPSIYFCNGTVCNEPFTGKVGDTITIALVISNLTDNLVTDPENSEVTRPLGNLNGFDVQISWDPTILKYVNHTVTTPVEDYPNPVPGSPYAGILHPDIFKLHEAVNESDNITNAELGTMAWFAYATMPGAPVFNGNGTFFTMTFNVTKRGSSPLKLTNVHLTGEDTSGQAHNFNPTLLFHTFDGLFRTAGAPTADFTFWPDVGVENESVIFDASASHSPINVSISKYIWDFGDETNATVSDPRISHSYSGTGTYTVSLVVEDSYGTYSSPKTEQVSVVEKRDVKMKGVSLMPADLVFANKTVDIEVTVKNDGRADENCTLQAYYNATAVNWADISATDWRKIGEIKVSLSLKYPWAIKHLIWNTTGVPQVEAYYYVLANITLVPYEKNTTDNTMISNPIFVTATEVHDVAFEELQFGWSEVFKSPVLSGEQTTFQVVVRNKGTEDEAAVNVTLYYNGSMLKSWNESLPYGESIELTCQKSLDPGHYNITARATIENDEHQDDNSKQEMLQVIRTPQLNFTYDPKTPYVNQTVSFDASASFHREPGASITQYKWEIYAPGETSPEVLSGPDMVNMTYQFGKKGVWRVVLSVTDSYNIKYKRLRDATSAYQIEARIKVQAPTGFPIEYTILISILIVAVALAVIIYRRRRTKP